MFFELVADTVHDDSVVEHADFHLELDKLLAVLIYNDHFFLGHGFVQFVGKSKVFIHYFTDPHVVVTNSDLSDIAEMF